MLNIWARDFVQSLPTAVEFGEENLHALAKIVILRLGGNIRHHSCNRKYWLMPIGGKYEKKRNYFKQLQVLM
jgi:hypothetical protein